MTLAHPGSEQELIEKAKAVVRRLQAALIPSVFPERPPDDAIVRELRAIVNSDGVALLLKRFPDHFFTNIIRKTQESVHAGGSNRDIIERLWAFMDDPELNRAVASDDPDEQPARLVHLMLEGPYKDAATGKPAKAAVGARK